MSYGAPDTLSTSRDAQILTALVRKVRLLSFEQIAKTWWPQSADPRQDARTRLAVLEQGGFVEERRVLARPMLSLQAPLFAWSPTDEAPDFPALSYRLQSRWTEPAALVSVYVATRRYANRVAGNGGPLKRPFQATHDLHLAAIYLHLLTTTPALAEAWVGEDALAPERVGQKLPDAILRDPQGRDRLVIEFGGAYEAERLADFHHDCAARSLPYQLW